MKPKEEAYKKSNDVVIALQRCPRMGHRAGRRQQGLAQGRKWVEVESQGTGALEVKQNFSRWSRE